MKTRESEEDVSDFKKLPIIKKNKERGVFHDSRGDVRNLSKIVNMLVDEVRKCQARIIELEKTI